MTTKLTRYSPGAYGAMVPDSDGDYVRLSEIEPRIRRAVDNAKDSGIFAGSLIAEENAQELAKLHDLLRWRKVGEETVPVTTTLILWHPEDGIRMSNWNRTIPAEIIEKSLRKEGVTHWRPIGPLPTEGGK